MVVGHDLSEIGAGKWSGAAIAPDGAIYCSPYNAKAVLKIGFCPVVDRVQRLLKDTPKALATCMRDTELRTLIIRAWARLLAVPDGPDAVVACLATCDSAELDAHSAVGSHLGGVAYAEVLVSAVTSARAPTVVTWLLERSVNLAPAHEASILSSSEWRGFVLDETCTDALCRLLDFSPALAPSSLSILMSVRKPTVVARLLNVPALMKIMDTVRQVGDSMKRFDKVLAVSLFLCFPLVPIGEACDRRRSPT